MRERALPQPQTFNRRDLLKFVPPLVVGGVGALVGYKLGEAQTLAAVQGIETRVSDLEGRMHEGEVRDGIHVRVLTSHDNQLRQLKGGK